MPLIAGVDKADVQLFQDIQQPVFNASPSSALRHRAPIQMELARAVSAA
ncbi:hypothetical protein NLM27_26490 [Bradyrhizobium sp. CCGB12]|nr:hypothetical protein [Bradyrhizobium sp. CCGB12]MCP3392303.1 hypothetical protein [Bradyrhizobium sp. CCGB12]